PKSSRPTPTTRSLPSCNGSWRWSRRAGPPAMRLGATGSHPSPGYPATPTPSRPQARAAPGETKARHPGAPGMREDELRALLEALRDGRRSTDEALARLRDLPFADLGVAHIDHHRMLRTGMPEVIFCEGKTPADVATIAAHMAERGSAVLGTRCSAEAFEA